MNTTVANDTMEFPPWRPLTAVNLLLFIAVLLPITLIVNISVFIALIKSKVKCKPLLILFGSLLLGVCLDKLLICIDESVNSPSTIRYCYCERWTILLLQIPRIFFTVYSVVAVNCLGIMQLLVMKGKQSSYKQTFFCMGISVVVAIIWTVIFAVTNGIMEYPIHCHDFCFGSNPPDIFSEIFFVVVSFFIFTLLPVLIVTITTSVWTLRIFRKKFIVRSDNKSAIELNRRMLLLPLLMIILLFCNSLLSLVLSSLTGLLLRQAGVEEFYGNWANIISKYEYFLLDLVHGLCYPLVLLYLYANVWETWKKLFSR